MTPAELQQRRQQEQAAAQVVHFAVKIQEKGAVPILIRELRKAVNKLRKQHYGLLPDEGEAAWKRLDEEFEILGEFAWGNLSVTDNPGALREFLEYLKTLFFDGADYGGINGKSHAETSSPLGWVESPGEADHLGGLAEGEGPDALGALGIGNQPGALVPDEDDEPFRAFGE